MFDHLENYFKALNCISPERGYLPDPTKSILVVHPQNPELGEELRRHHRFKVCTGAHYLGGYIGDEKPKAIVSNIARRNGRETFVLSEKRPISVLRRVMPQWPVWFNQNGSSFKVLLKKHQRLSQGWEKFCGKPLLPLIFFGN